MDTDTRIERPSGAVLARADKARNDGSTQYLARHRHVPGPPAGGAAHVALRTVWLRSMHEQTAVIPRVPAAVAETQQIDVGNLRISVPLPSRPAPEVEEVPAAAVSAPVEQPLEDVNVGLLERIRSALRRLK